MSEEPTSEADLIYMYSGAFLRLGERHHRTKAEVLYPVRHHDVLLRSDVGVDIRRVGIHEIPKSTDCLSGRQRALRGRRHCSRVLHRRHLFLQRIHEQRGCVYRLIDCSDVSRGCLADEVPLDTRNSEPVPHRRLSFRGSGSRVGRKGKRVSIALTI